MTLKSVRNYRLLDSCKPLKLTKESKQSLKGQVFVDRFAANETKASAANSRKKMIEKIKEQMPDVAHQSSESTSSDISLLTTCPPLQ